MSIFSNKELEQRILAILATHVGHEKAIDRWTLVLQIFGPGADQPQNDQNLNDRAIRDAVHRLRSEGHLICDLGDGRGRFLSRTEEDYRAFRAAYYSSVKPRIDAIKAMDKAAKEKYPNLLQPALFNMDDLLVTP